MRNLCVKQQDSGNSCFILVKISYLGSISLISVEPANYEFCYEVHFYFSACKGTKYTWNYRRLCQLITRGFHGYKRLTKEKSKDIVQDFISSNVLCGDVLLWNLITLGSLLHQLRYFNSSGGIIQHNLQKVLYKSMGQRFVTSCLDFFQGTLFQCLPLIKFLHIASMKSL